VIYSIGADGKLLWYRHEGHLDGTARWTNQQGQQVGTGWQIFRTVFGGDNGVIYAIGADGKLLWYRHEGHLDGTARWTNQQGQQVGTGWNIVRLWDPLHGFKTVFGGDNGVIYAIGADGKLFWYKHEGHFDGTARWTNQQGQEVGAGWQIFRTVFGGNNGVIYAVGEV